MIQAAELKKEKGREVWVKGEIVLEVGFEEIQKSPTYNSGFALRFPRVIQLRADMDIGDITSLGEIKEEFDKQKK